MDWGWKANLKRAALAGFGLVIGAALAPPSPSQSQDRVPGDAIRERIQERMERKRLERVPRLGSVMPAPGGGPGQETIVIGGRVRTFLRYTPNKVLVGGKRAPVVFALHGAKGSADRLPAYLGLNAVADREGFLVVYPQGIDNRWNDGRTPDETAVGDANDADDTGFLNGLADALVAQGVADPKRLFVSGISSGGFMALKLGCTEGSRFAGYGAIAASMPVSAKDACKLSSPVPVVMINGTADEIIPFGGTSNRPEPQNIAPPLDVAARFADLNGCSSASEMPVSNADGKNPVNVTLRSWSGCKTGASVEFYAVKGGGHQAPAINEKASSIVLDMLVGARSHDLDTAETIWAFFKRF